MGVCSWCLNRNMEMIYKFEGNDDTVNMPMDPQGTPAPSDEAGMPVEGEEKKEESEHPMDEAPASEKQPAM